MLYCAAVAHQPTPMKPDPYFLLGLALGLLSSALIIASQVHPIRPVAPGTTLAA
jgi:hypothetical protein